MSLLWLAVVLLSHVTSGLPSSHQKVKEFGILATDKRLKTVEKRDYECVPLGQCEFPFTYKGNSYYTCTATDRGHTFWCSRDKVYVEGTSEWSECSCSGCTPHPDCVFPFTHTNSNGESETLGSCTLDDDTKYWCADGSGNKLYCDCLSCKPPNGCVFPFQYDGITYNQCTQRGSSEFWCPHVATTDSLFYYYSYCEECDLCEAPPSCSFPFEYYGSTYSGCTRDYDDRYWCAHTQDFDGSYSYCDCNVKDITGAKCDKPAGCVFPFTYQGLTYTGCTEVNYLDFWCSMDAQFSGRFITCDCTALCTPADECVPDFTYNGKVYATCANTNGVYWCSHNTNYVLDSAYSKCHCEV